MFFTDISSEIYHVRPLGAYRLATELRKHGYRVLVVEYFSKWLKDKKNLARLLKKSVGEDTLMVGYSSTFFAKDEGAKSDAKTYREYHESRRTNPWPTDSDHIRLLNQSIKRLAPRAKIFYGGALAGTVRRRHLREDGVDYVVQGLADNVIVEIMDNLRDDRPLRFNFKDDIKIIDYDLAAHGFDFPNCRTEFVDSDCVESGEMLPLEISRGCMFKCSFCAYPLLGRKKNDGAYHKDIESLAQEIKQNHEKWGVFQYMITDDTFNETTDKLLNVKKAIEISGVPVRFSAYLRVDLIERFPEQIQILRDMGLQSCFVGVETLNGRAGRSIGKTSHSERIKKVLEDMREIWGDDVNVYAHFITGLPHETLETMEVWAQWVYDRSDLIDGFFMHNLQLTHERVYPSELGSDPGKYGYQILPDGTWINNTGLTQKESDEFAWRWMEKSWSSGRMRVGGLAMIALLNLGYDFGYLHRLSLNIMPLGEFAGRFHEKFLRYQDRLLGYLDQD